MIEDEKFWEAEKKNTKESRLIINKLKNLETYDVMQLNPQTYEGKLSGGGGGGGKTMLKGKAARKAARAH